MENEIDYSKVNQDALTDILGTSDVANTISFPEVGDVLPEDQTDEIITVKDVWDLLSRLNKEGKIVKDDHAMSWGTRLIILDFDNLKISEKKAIEKLGVHLQGFRGKGFVGDKYEGYQHYFDFKSIGSAWGNWNGRVQAFLGNDKEYAKKYNKIEEGEILYGPKKEKTISEESNVSLDGIDSELKREDSQNVKEDQKLDSSNLTNPIEESNVTSDGIEKDQKEQIKKEDSALKSTNKKQSHSSNRDIDVMKEDYLLAFLTSFYHQLKIKDDIKEIWASIRSLSNEKENKVEPAKENRIVTRIEDKDGNVSYNICTKDSQAFTLDLEQHKDKSLKIDTFEIGENSISIVEDILKQPDIALSKEDTLKLDSELAKKANWITTKDFEDENSILKTEYSKQKNLDIPIEEIEKNINWNAIEKNTGITKAKLQKEGNYERFIIGQETSIMSLKTPCGDDSNILNISTEGRLKLIRNEEGEYKVITVDNHKLELLKTELTSEQKEDKKNSNRYFVSKDGQDFVIKKDGEEVKIERLPNLRLEQIKNEYHLSDKDLLKLRNGETLNIEYQTQTGKTKNADIALTNLSINNQTRQEAQDLQFNAKSSFALRIFNKRDILPKNEISQTEGAGVKFKRH